MIASNSREHVKNTLQGFFFDIELPSGLTLKDCSLHERDGKRWIGLPGKAQIDSEGRHTSDPNTGRKLYVTIVEIKDRGRREWFQNAALAAVDRLLGTHSGNGSAKFHPITGEIVP